MFTHYGLRDEQIEGAITEVAYHFEFHRTLKGFFKPAIVSACGKSFTQEIRAKETPTQAASLDLILEVRAKYWERKTVANCKD